MQILEQIRANQNTPWIRWPGDELIASMAKSQIDYMQTRDLVEPEEIMAFNQPELAKELQQLGIPDSREFRQIYDESLETGLPSAFAKMGIKL